MKNLSKWFKWIVSIAFFALLFASVSKGDLFSRFSDLNMKWFAASFALIPIMIFTSCLKWKAALKHLGFDVSFGRLMRIYMVGYFFTNVLPSTVGGDVVRSFYVGRDIKDQGHAAVSVFIERFSGLLLLLVLGFTAPLLSPGLYQQLGIIIPAILAFLLLAIVTWVWFIPEPLKGPDKIIRALFGALGKLGFPAGLLGKLERMYGKVHAAVDAFHSKLVHAVRGFGKAPGTFAWITFLTLLFYLMTWVNVYCAFRTFNVHLDFWEMSAVVPTIMLTFLLPVSQGNLGLAEGAYVFYFGLIGIDMASALAMALFMRFKLLCAGTVGYFFYLALGARRPRPVTESREDE